MNDRIKPQQVIDFHGDELGIDSIDREAVQRFIDDAIIGSRPKKADAQHAGILLAGLMWAVRSGDNVGALLRQQLNIRKHNDSKIDPDRQHLGTPAWNIVERYVRGEIKHVTAVNQFKDEFGKSARVAERFIAAMKTRVKSLIDAIDEEKENAAKK